MKKIVIALLTVILFSTAVSAQKRGGTAPKSRTRVSSKAAESVDDRFSFSKFRTKGLI